MTSALPLVQDVKGDNLRLLGREHQLTPSIILRILRSSGVFHSSGHFNHAYAVLPEVLGKGTFGRVSKCRSVLNDTGKLFAVKEIPYAKLKRREVQDIINEVLCLRALNHIHIVHFKDAFIEGSNVFIVEELLMGTDGFEAILQAEGGLPPVVCKSIVNQLASAVAYLHTKRIVHRDIKLENIMLIPSLSHSYHTVKLVDFGLATSLDNNVAASSFSSCITSSYSYQIDKRLTRFCGTPHYMAPEIVRRERYGRPVDVWALGVLLYMLMTGETLWEEQEPSKVLRSIAKSKWSFDQCPSIWGCKDEDTRQVRELISSCLRPNAAFRSTAFAVCTSDWLHKRKPHRTQEESSNYSLQSQQDRRSTSWSAPGSMSRLSLPRHLSLSSEAAVLHKARLGLLEKREFLHLKVSKLIDYCRARHHQESLAEVNRKLTALLTTAVAMARGLTRADRGTLFIVVNEDDKDGTNKSFLFSKVAEGELSARPEDQQDQKSKAIRVPIGTGIAGTVAASGDSINVRNAYEDERFDASHDQRTGYLTRSVLCVPVPHAQNGRTIGTVQMINKIASDECSSSSPSASFGVFSDEDMDLLHDLAVHVGFALTMLLAEIGDHTTRQLFSVDMDSMTSSTKEKHSPKGNDSTCQQTNSPLGKRGWNHDDELNWVLGTDKSQNLKSMNRRKDDNIGRSDSNNDRRTHNRSTKEAKEILTTEQSSSTLDVGTRVEVVSPSKKTRVCTVVGVQGDSRIFAPSATSPQENTATATSRLRIHYEGFDCSHDEWLSVRQRHRVRRVIGRSRRIEIDQNQQHRRSSLQNLFIGQDLKATKYAVNSHSVKRGAPADNGPRCAVS